MYPIIVSPYPRNPSPSWYQISSALNWTGFLSVFSRHDDSWVVVREELFVIFWHERRKYRDILSRGWTEVSLLGPITVRARTDGVARHSLALPSSTVTGLSIRIISTLTSPYPAQSHIKVRLLLSEHPGCVPSPSQSTGISLSFILIIIVSSQGRWGDGAVFIKIWSIPN